MSGYLTETDLTRVNATPLPALGDEPLHLAAKAIGANGIPLPAHDHQAVTYHDDTNNVDTVEYYQGGSGGTLVATITYSYVDDATGADNARIATVSLTLP